MSVKYDATSIAKWFIAYSIHKNKPIKKTKLQKLLYYAQAHSLSENNQVLFEDAIKAVQYGPVVSSVLDFTSEHPANDTLSLSESFDFRGFASVNHLLIKVWNTYGGMTGTQLSQKTHNELPWIFGRDEPDAVIDIDMLRGYYRLRDVRE